MTVYEVCKNLQPEKMSNDPKCVIYSENWLPSVLLNIKSILSSRQTNSIAEDFPGFDQADDLIINCNSSATQSLDLKKDCKIDPISARRKRSARRNHQKNVLIGKKCKSKTKETSSDSSCYQFDPRSSNCQTDTPIVSRLMQFTFYSVLNTGIAMDQSTAASALCRSFLALYMKLEESNAHAHYLDSWDKSGQKIVVLEGYNDKHLRYLANEVRHVATDSNTLSRRTGRTQIMLVLTAFGVEEDMEEAFDDLCYLH